MSFVARIKDTNQLVKFIKIEYSEKLFPRFEVLVKLFRDGVVLADNVFLLEEGGEYYFYIIEAYIAKSCSQEDQSFQTLQQYLMKDIQYEERKQIFKRLKVLFEKLHQTGEYYGGLTSQKILIDDQKNLYLAPFKLTFELPNNLYENAYRPPELIKKIIKGELNVENKNLAKWDFWSFGCICLEIFVTCSPYYHSYCLESLLKKMADTKMLDEFIQDCLLYTSPSPRDLSTSRMPSSA